MSCVACTRKRFPPTLCTRVNKEGERLCVLLVVAFSRKCCFTTVVTFVNLISLCSCFWLNLKAYIKQIHEF